jgi:hypothetical protein
VRRLGFWKTQRQRFAGQDRRVLTQAAAFFLQVTRQPQQPPELVGGDVLQIQKIRQGGNDSVHRALLPSTASDDEW